MEASGPSDRTLCARGCGFYGSVETKNLCSKCYSDYLREQISKTLNATAKPRVTSQQPSTAVEAEPAIPTKADQPRLAEAPAIGKKRCRSCNKKLGLLGFKCKCGQDFCSDHRYPEKHSCDFDFKTAERRMLATQLPEIKADKLERI